MIQLTPIAPGKVLSSLSGLGHSAYIGYVKRLTHNFTNLLYGLALGGWHRQRIIIRSLSPTSVGLSEGIFSWYKCNSGDPTASNRIRSDSKDL